MKRKAFKLLKHSFHPSALRPHPFVPVFGKRLSFRAFMYVKRARVMRELWGANAIPAQCPPLFS